MRREFINRVAAPVADRQDTNQRDRSSFSASLTPASNRCVTQGRRTGSQVLTSESPKPERSANIERQPDDIAKAGLVHEGRCLQRLKPSGFALGLFGPVLELALNLKQKYEHLD